VKFAQDWRNVVELQAITEKDEEIGKMCTLHAATLPNNRYLQTRLSSSGMTIQQALPHYIKLIA